MPKEYFLLNLIQIQQTSTLIVIMSTIFQYISNRMQHYTVLLYLESALHVSSGISTHHQERIQLYLQHLAFVTSLLLPASIVEELFQLFHDSDK
jgi:hypothetical protein